METTPNRNTATLTHLSALAQYIVPLGNFIFPIVIWSSFKKNSAFVDHHGRQAINFQLSLFLYMLIIAMVAIPAFIYSIASKMPQTVEISGDEIFFRELAAGKFADTITIGAIAVILFGAMKIGELALIVYAAVKATHGEWFKYPLTINFLGPDKSPEIREEPM